MSLKHLSNGTWQVYLYDPEKKGKRYVGVCPTLEEARALETELRPRLKGLPPDPRVPRKRRPWLLKNKGERKCRNCGAKAAALHHIVPRVVTMKGAKDWERNGLPLCFSCHRGWHNRAVEIPHDVLTDAEFLYACDLTSLEWVARHYLGSKDANIRYWRVEVRRGGLEKAA